MKYFIDTEFIEGAQTPSFFLKGRLGNLIGAYKKPTIDLISIGIVAENGRQYYALSKDFNLKEAWGRFDTKIITTPQGNKIRDNQYWIRDNVLLPIYKEHIGGDMRNHFDFSYSTMKWILKNYGKSNKQIAIDIQNFCVQEFVTESDINKLATMYPLKSKLTTDKGVVRVDNPQFYAYYADYDWVVFCWLFGRMNNLPKGFPMYCIDLKQALDARAEKFSRSDFFTAFDFKNDGLPELTLEEKIEHLKKHVNYPSQINEHNALADARWNKELYHFLERL